MSIVLANATLASFSPRQLGSGHVVVSNGRIESVTSEIPAAAGEILDCSGRFIMPGNVCAHTHLYSALARGMPASPKPPGNFLEILEYIWWRLDRALDEESVRSSALAGSLDAARCGTTTLLDHHASPNFIRGSLDVLADAIDLVGLRGVLCYEVTDRGGPEKSRAGLDENRRFLESNARPLIRGMVGAHASFTLEDGTLRQLAELAGTLSTGIHIHVAEDAADEEDSLRRCGKRVAFRLRDAGILGAGSIAAHCVHLRDPEIEAVRRSGAWLVHNCRSNMNNSVGRAPVAEFGLHSALGTDGIDHDMFSESRTAYFRAREVSLGAYAEQFTDFLARGGDLASQLFGEQIGSIKRGAVADLVVLNYDPPTPLTAENLAWHWMFALNPQNVESVMAGGEWVIRKGEFVRVDEEKIRAEAKDQAGRLWKRMGEL